LEEVLDEVRQLVLVVEVELERHYVGQISQKIVCVFVLVDEVLGLVLLEFETLDATHTYVFVMLT
jgi:hypothetical protein